MIVSSVGTFQAIEDRKREAIPNMSSHSKSSAVVPRGRRDQQFVEKWFFWMHAAAFRGRQRSYTSDLAAGAAAAITSTLTSAGLHLAAHARPRHGRQLG